MSEWSVQTRSLGTWGNWRDLPAHSFSFGFARYDDTWLEVNGSRYRKPWRVILDGKVIAQSDGYRLADLAIVEGRG